MIDFPQRQTARMGANIEPADIRQDNRRVRVLARSRFYHPGTCTGSGQLELDDLLNSDQLLIVGPDPETLLTKAVEDKPGLATGSAVFTGIFRLKHPNNGTRPIAEEAISWHHAFTKRDTLENFDPGSRETLPFWRSSN